MVETKIPGSEERSAVECLPNMGEAPGFNSQIWRKGRGKRGRGRERRRRRGSRRKRKEEENNSWRV